MKGLGPVSSLERGTAGVLLSRAVAAEVKAEDKAMRTMRNALQKMFLLVMEQELKIVSTNDDLLDSFCF